LWFGVLGLGGGGGGHGGGGGGGWRGGWGWGWGVGSRVDGAVVGLGETHEAATGSQVRPGSQPPPTVQLHPDEPTAHVGWSVGCSVGCGVGLAVGLSETHSMSLASQARPGSQPPPPVQAQPGEPS
jgi:hypothetical protein